MLSNEDVSNKIAQTIKEGPYKTKFYLENLNMSEAMFSLSLSGKRKWTVPEFLVLNELLSLDLKNFTREGVQA